MAGGYTAAAGGGWLNWGARCCSLPLRLRLGGAWLELPAVGLFFFVLVCGTAGHFLFVFGSAARGAGRELPAFLIARL
jgi:hypothetical protein